METGADYDVVVVSDLHLSAGADPATGIYHPNEDFFVAEAFARFVDHLLERGRREGRRWRLVILGDFVDFLQIDLPSELGAGLTSAEGSLARLEIASRGHPAVFAALTRWIADDHRHRLDLVIGNHDVEFVWPAVQQALRRLIGADDGVRAARVAFHSWILHVPGLLYAEHGHQYDAVNSFLTPLAPFLPDNPRLIALPLGSFFVRYLFNAVERVDPFADNVKPMTRYLGWALRAHPILTLTTLPSHLRLFLGVLRKTTPLAPEQRQRRRERYRRETLGPAAGRIGLPPATLFEIDALAAIPTMTSPWEQFKALTLRPVGPTAAGAAAVAAVLAGIGRLPERARAARWPVAGLAFLVWREWPELRPPEADGGGLRAVARRVDALLREADRQTAATDPRPDRRPFAVPAYVFGHTHRAERCPLTDEPGAPVYLNSGTWTPIVPPSFSLVGSRDVLSFVEVARDAATGRPRPSLLVWNDAAGRAEPLRREPGRG